MTDSLPNSRCRVWHVGQERLEHGSCACERAHWYWYLCEHGLKRGRGLPLLVLDQAVESAVYQLVYATAFACFHRLNHAMAYLLADLFGIFAELIHSCSCVATILIFSGRKERHRALLNLAPYSDLSAPESAWVSNSILPLSVYDFGDVLRSVTFRQTRMKKSAAVAFRLSRRWFRRRQIWTLATQEAQHL